MNLRADNKGTIIAIGLASSPPSCKWQDIIPHFVCAHAHNPAASFWLDVEIRHNPQDALHKYHTYAFSNSKIDKDLIYSTNPYLSYHNEATFL
jgi:hypothetical protein